MHRFHGAQHAPKHSTGLPSTPVLYENEAHRHAGHTAETYMALRLGEQSHVTCPTHAQAIKNKQPNQLISTPHELLDVVNHETH